MLKNRHAGTPVITASSIADSNPGLWCQKQKGWRNSFEAKGDIILIQKKNEIGMDGRKYYNEWDTAIKKWNMDEERRKAAFTGMALLRGSEWRIGETPIVSEGHAKQVDMWN